MNLRSWIKKTQAGRIVWRVIIGVIGGGITVAGSVALIGVVSTPAEIDLCMLMGAGWPMHLGGILPYLDREGISESVTGKRFHEKGVASLP